MGAPGELVDGHDALEREPAVSQMAASRAKVPGSQETMTTVSRDDRIS
jgi:hypothetical protein